MDKGSANAAVLACCVSASRNLQSRRDTATLAGGANHRSFAMEDNQPPQGRWVKRSVRQILPH
jgi:hypothetical protein